MATTTRSPCNIFKKFQPRANATMYPCEMTLLLPCHWPSGWVGRCWLTPESWSAMSPTDPTPYPCVLVQVEFLCKATPVLLSGHLTTRRQSTTEFFCTTIFFLDLKGRTNSVRGLFGSPSCPPTTSLNIRTSWKANVLNWMDSDSQTRIYLDLYLYA